MDSKKVFVFTLCAINGGTAPNVMCEHTTMNGSIRFYDKNLIKEVIEKIENIATETALSFGCTADCKFVIEGNPTINSEIPTKAVEAVVKEHFGEDLLTTKGIPFLGSEDFCNFSDVVPGCYLMQGMHDSSKGEYDCHSNKFDYNDKTLASGIFLWSKVVENRLGIKFKP